MGMKFNCEGILCYSREYGKWQMTWIDNMMAHMSLYSGDYANEKIILSGEESYQGQKFLARTTFFNITENKFDWTMYSSFDDGKTWIEMMKAEYTRKM
jgi:hypothetical protein